MEHAYSDEQIIEGIKTQNNLVLSCLYSEYKEKILKYVIRNSGSKNEAEDVFQEAVIKVYVEVQKTDFVLKKTFNEYFTSICSNTWIIAVKLKKKQNITDQFPDELADLDFLDEYKKEQLQKLIMEQFILLGENCQKILDMFYYQKKPMAEIAYRMDYKNEQIAKNKKYRCLEYLKEQIKKQPNYKILKDE